MYLQRKMYMKTKKNLVFSSVGDLSQFDKLWAQGGENYDIWVVYYGDNEETFKRYKNASTYAIQRKGAKFQNFFYVYEKFKECIEEYEYIFIPDDDLIIDTNSINGLFKLAKEYNLSICQPAFDSNSKVSWNVTRHHKNNILRLTNFVEVTAMLFSKPALVNTMRYFDPSLIGWGIDYLSIWANGVDVKNTYAVIDAITCCNPGDSRKGGVRELSKVHDWEQREDIWLKVKKRLGIQEWLKINHQFIRDSNEGTLDRNIEINYSCEVRVLGVFKPYTEKLFDYDVKVKY